MLWRVRHELHLPHNSVTLSLHSALKHLSSVMFALSARPYVSFLSSKPAERYPIPLRHSRSFRAGTATSCLAHYCQLSAPVVLLVLLIVAVFFFLPSTKHASPATTASVSPTPLLSQRVSRFLLQRSNVNFQPVAADSTSSENVATVVVAAVEGQSGQTHSSLLSTLQNYGSHHRYNHTFHSDLFNQPALSLPDDIFVCPHRPATSNRAIAHSFPTPLPHLLTMFSASLAMGVFTSDAARMELMMDTFGRYLPASHILYFVPDTKEMRTHVNGRRLSNVYLLPGGTSSNDHTSKSADHHILKALQTLVTMRPDAPFYFLCDDDTFPVIPRIATYLHRFYHNTMYTASDKLFLGDRTLNVDGQVALLSGSERQLDMILSYHPADGGLLLNSALATALEPHTATCPLLSTWDLTLA